MTNDGKTIFKQRPRGECPHCGQLDMILYTTREEDFTGCAECYKTYVRQFERVTPCDNCGKTPAYRDPSHRRNEYLCSECHLKQGFVQGVRALAPDAPRYSPTHVEGRRAVCELAGSTTKCRGQVKPRGSKGVLCDFHNDPKRFNKQP